MVCVCVCAHWGRGAVVGNQPNMWESKVVKRDRVESDSTYLEGQETPSYFHIWKRRSRTLMVYVGTYMYTRAILICLSEREWACVCVCVGVCVCAVYVCCGYYTTSTS